MDATTTNPNFTNPNLALSPEQERLLFAALNSNKSTSVNTSPLTLSKDQLAMAPAAYTESPLDALGYPSLGNFDESPFIDDYYDFDAEAGLEYGFANDSQSQMIGELPGPTSSDGDVEAEGNDKRSHPDDDDDNEEGGGKRREGDEKASKKPGRKPLTSEPTSKRKAQNRAAQRAFRERKEKHLKDLETKVDDLQKASESANHENSILRAQVEKMAMELRAYRKRLSLNSSNASRTPSLGNGVPPYLSGKGLVNSGANNPDDVNFQFAFPKFGLPPKQSPATGKQTQGTTSPAEESRPSPLDRNTSYQSVNSSSSGLNQTPVDTGDMSSFSGLFSPTLLESVNKSPNFDFFSTGSRSSINSNGQTSNGQTTSHSSPSASSNSNRGSTSSCGTSPEPSMQSPAPAKPTDATLSTIGEEHPTDGEGELTFCGKLNMACGNPNNPIPRTISESSTGNFAEHGFDINAFDVNGIDWFAQQNGNQFDPKLFGDYREPQENILASGDYTEGFFKDAFTMPEFNTPFNTATSHVTSRKDKPVDEEVVPAQDPSQLLTCNTIWDRLQACPKVKEGEFDLDLLCKDLQKKAKCSETGAVVNESDFNKIMKTHIGPGKSTNNKA